MNRSPTPGGVFRGCFVGECGHFTERWLGISWVFATISRNIRNTLTTCLLY
ncbi:hypothetical protein [Prevotella pallens]|uniref:hypothetical protein n=1 Tax=Prevotella pallens TaxID=60133 RepID=UPI001CB0949E|nr:hypothetical protein [Prevotella pallens]MBF1451243.1 hypothetical protein [Prevotella pallens]MBF1466976.1 hypothetical protein [Prevotella pallens]MBF1513317.1 hypothetical protein [Prevotella pallens]